MGKWMLAPKVMHNVPFSHLWGFICFMNVCSKCTWHVRFEDAALILWFLRWSAQWQGEGKHPWEVCAVSGQSRETQEYLKNKDKQGKKPVKETQSNDKYAFSSYLFCWMVLMNEVHCSRWWTVCVYRSDSDSEGENPETKEAPGASDGWVCVLKGSYDDYFVCLV